MCAAVLQARKSENTRQTILKAAIEEILTEGIHHATTINIAQRAGMSRGAILHHYPTRDELMHAALEKVLLEELESFKELTKQAKSKEITLDELLDHIWEHFSGPMFMVSLEYLTAARTNKEIKGVLMPLARDFNNSIEEIWGTMVPDPHLREATLHSTLCMMRGMSLQSIWREDPGFSERLLLYWKEQIRKSIEGVGD
ncbi:TetR/AcrR family transcriptional regulator [Halomonas daqingensis]|uniref:TetR/AcrR family transcriptional regulator n=1 Tax=Billgrantia desiderata TaxID=52021 RepID=A0AAW4YR38_9GAMM|nr:TetR/AcrR family transcriptional regulator [Halomonas desiderata]MCE8027104.1 TetR/AcrR family transcriptional regulator [Halomonas desiderata]MCE8040729.1 TetR/AcrR family transcriptional regulator [Halomonas desiderata]MCE8045304.1 TetR/AcrR family transcriptional regulator [Halomonas desiderata]MCE8050729.1 TetR/AcrR family transcriptional regulator [Halomonas desiderata]